jgi:hypothetical protein
MKRSWFAFQPLGRPELEECLMHGSVSFCGRLGRWLEVGRDASCFKISVEVTRLLQKWSFVDRRLNVPLAGMRVEQD